VGLCTVPPIICGVFLYVDRHGLCANKKAADVSISIISGIISYGLLTCLLDQIPLLVKPGHRELLAKYIKMIWAYGYALLIASLLTAVCESAT
jgi:hypothetical protein